MYHNDHIQWKRARAFTANRTRCSRAITAQSSRAPTDRAPGIARTSLSFRCPHVSPGKVAKSDRQEAEAGASFYFNIPGADGRSRHGSGRSWCRSVRPSLCEWDHQLPVAPRTPGPSPAQRPGEDTRGMTTQVLSMGDLRSIQMMPGHSHHARSPAVAEVRSRHRGSDFDLATGARQNRAGSGEDRAGWSGSFGVVSPILSFMEMASPAPPAPPPTMYPGLATGCACASAITFRERRARWPSVGSSIPAGRCGAYA